MFTQCSKCETIFKLTAEVLRAAAGQVRCGRCGEVFNALERLAEDPAAFASGESEFELESRADHILESAEEPSPAAEELPDDLDLADVEIASLRVDSWDEETVVAEDAALEFSLPPRELDRIFVEDFRSEPMTPEGSESIPSFGLTVSDAARRELLAATASPAPPEPPAPLAIADAAAAPPASIPMPGHPPGATPPTAEDFEYLAGRGRAPRGRGAWLAAAMLLGACLFAQVLHRQRAALAATAGVGPVIQALYARLGEDLAPVPSPSAYQLRQWGVTGDPAASGVLHVRASLLNSTTRFEPYPLLRVTLADRFGARIGMRNFEPAEYLGKPTLHLLSPGERADATIDILDPGKNAEGYEIDVCVRGPGQLLHCQGDPPSPSR